MNSAGYHEELPRQLEPQGPKAPQQWCSVPRNMEHPKGKASPESGGLSRTVENFSHNETQTELHGAEKKGTLVHQGVGRREGKKDLIVTVQ